MSINRNIRQEYRIKLGAVSGTTAGRIGRPKRHDHAYDYRKVPTDYNIPQAWHAWVSGVKPNAP